MDRDFAAAVSVRQPAAQSVQDTVVWPVMKGVGPSPSLSPVAVLTLAVQLHPVLRRLDMDQHTHRESESP